MRFNKKYLLAIPALAIAGVVAAGSVSAAGPGGGMGGGRGMGGPMHSGFGGALDPDKFVEHLTQEASVLGISLDEMKAYWAQGKNVQDIATAKGLTKEQLKAKLEAAAEAKATANLKALVDKGIITQAQADSRATVMKEMKAKMTENMKNKVQQKRGVKPAPRQTTTTQSQS